MKKTLSIICLSAFLLAAPSQSVLADVGTINSSPERPKDTRGPHCSFSHGEKIGMMLWLVPLAGAIYTPFACKREVFGAEGSEGDHAVADSESPRRRVGPLGDIE